MLFGLPWKQCRRSSVDLLDLMHALPVVMCKCTLDITAQHLDCRCLGQQLQTEEFPRTTIGCGSKNWMCVTFQ